MSNCGKYFIYDLPTYQDTTIIMYHIPLQELPCGNIEYSNLELLSNGQIVDMSELLQNLFGRFISCLWWRGRGGTEQAEI